ncbi:resistance to inhibitors of cholinesterase protein 3 isoform X3 [Adelges cooleyi]|uniref:resistance to inhibitors of cholinesterase protein 3 isoform X3 n=1 Tax=Adelges cooleyi TaxID=133065 RepID=UPI00217FFFF4|nr:resistance to inhibitors of cholinesterase protein 3 isoform X3 [Adelges cooleyi]
MPAKTCCRGTYEGKPSMNSEISQSKTICILAIVAGCFAVLLPSLFYPMIKSAFIPSYTHTGCCDVVTSSDMNLVKIITDICDRTIEVKDKNTYWEMCHHEIYNTCAINITDLVSGNQAGVIVSSNKHVVDEIRSLNGSLCLKYHYGVSLTSLGVAHRLKEFDPNSSALPQERIPVHLRASQGGIHPALLEKGRAIPQPRSSSFPTPNSFKPPMPGIKPPMVNMGSNHRLGDGEGGGSMNLLMPMYTIGIFLFFVYTIMKLLTKKNEDEPDDVYQNMYSHQQYSQVSNGKDHGSAKQQPPQMGPLKLGELEIDALRRKLEETEAAMERIVKQMILASECSRMEGKKELESLNANGVPSAIKLVDCESNDDRSQVTSTTDSGVIDTPIKEELGSDDQQTEEMTDSEVYGKKVIQVVNMETSEGVDGGRCWTPKEKEDIRSSDDTSLSEPVSLFIPGPIPKNSQVLISDGPHNTPGETEDHESVVSSKVTLSLIPDDRVHENGTNEDEEEEEEDDDEEEEEDDDDDESNESDDDEDDTTKTNTPTKTKQK